MTSPAQQRPPPPVGRLEILLEQFPGTDGLPEVMTGLSRQNSAYRHVLDVCDQLADAALRGADAQAMSTMLAQLLGRTVVLLDPRFAQRSGAAAGTPGPEWNADDPGARRLLRALAAERRPLRVPAVPDSVLLHGCLAVPIVIGPTDLGYLLILDDPAGGGTDDTDLLIASYVATLFALTLANERTSVELGVRYRAAIVDALVSGHFLDADDAARKAQALGMPDAPLRVGVLRVKAESPSATGLDQWEELRAAIARSVPGAVVSVRGAELVMILPDPADPVGAELAVDAELVARLGEAIAAASARPAWHQSGDPRLTCGLSDSVAQADQLPRSLQEAEHAVEIGTRIGRSGQVIAYGELGIYRLLLQIGDMQQLWAFAEEILGPLIRYDATHKLGLVRTLSVFLNQRESLKQSARRLRVHTNTVSYRLQRIEQLTPLNLANPDDRLVAHIAVKILQAQRGDGLDSGSR